MPGQGPRCTITQYQQCMHDGSLARSRHFGEFLSPMMAATFSAVLSKKTRGPTVGCLFPPMYSWLLGPSSMREGQGENSGCDMEQKVRKSLWLPHFRGILKKLWGIPGDVPKLSYINNLGWIKMSRNPRFSGGC